jgi:hypothetical protein
MRDEACHAAAADSSYLEKFPSSGNFFFRHGESCEMKIFEFLYSKLSRSVPFRFHLDSKSLSTREKNLSAPIFS